MILFKVFFSSQKIEPYAYYFCQNFSPQKGESFWAPNLTCGDFFYDSSTLLDFGLQVFTAVVFSPLFVVNKDVGVGVELPHTF